MNNLARVFNLRAGLTGADDTLPKRLQTEPIKAGGSKGAMIPPAELKRMLSDYYSERGWTADGVPTREKLMALELDEAVPFVPAAAAQ